MANPAGTETVVEAKKRAKETPTQPEREHSAIEVSPKSPCDAIPLGRCPSYQQNPKIAQEMKKLRILHILNVPPSRPKTNVMFDPNFTSFRAY